MVSEIKDTEKKEDKKEDKPEDKGEGGGKGEGEGKDKGKKGSKNTGIKPDKEDVKRAKKKLRDAEDMNDIFKTYRYKKDWKYLEKHLQQWQGEPYDFIDNYYKSPDWAYYKPASKHNELVDAINGRKYPLKSDSYVERTVGLAKEILGVFVKMFVVVYVGCFLMWNSFHSVQSKDLDLDDENHQFNVDKFMNMIEIYQDQSPDVYIFVKSIYVGLAKIPRDALYYVFCQINKIMDPLYYGGGGGALWDAKKAYGRTPSQIRSVIQLLIVGVLPFVMYYTLYKAHATWRSTVETRRFDCAFSFSLQSHFSEESNGVFEGGSEVVHLFDRIVQVGACPDGRGHAKLGVERLRAQVPRPDGKAALIQDRAQVRRMEALHVECCQGPPWSIKRRAVDRESFVYVRQRGMEPGPQHLFVGIHVLHANVRHKIACPPKPNRLCDGWRASLEPRRRGGERGLL